MEEPASPPIQPPPTPARNALALLGWLALCFGAAAVGARFLPGEWYAQLVKPSWNPPNWVFGPVWTTLYAMMAIAAWRVWQRGGWMRQRGPLGWFLLQLGFNAAWSYLFFGKQQIFLAFIDIVALWTALLLTLLAFWRVRPVSGLLLVPYLAWVTFATALNFALWRLNR